MTNYVFELADVGETLDRRYDDIKTGRVELFDGDTFFDDLRQREDPLLKSQQR